MPPGCKTGPRPETVRDDGRRRGRRGAFREITDMTGAESGPELNRRRPKFDETMADGRFARPVAGLAAGTRNGFSSLAGSGRYNVQSSRLEANVISQQLFDEAVMLFGAGDYHRAGVIFRRLAGPETEPGHIYADTSLHFLAECHRHLTSRLLADGEPAKAAALLEQALTDFPGHPDLEFRLGIAEHDQGQYGPAIRRFEELLAGGHETTAVCLCLATACLNAGRPDRVENLVHRALQPVAELCHVQGVARFRMNQPGGALAALEKAVELRAGQPEVLLRLAALLILGGRDEEAQLRLEEVLPGLPDPAAAALPLLYLREKRHIVTTNPRVRIFLYRFQNQDAGRPALEKWADQLFHQVLAIDSLALPFMSGRGELMRQDWFRQLLVDLYQRMIRGGQDLPELYFRAGREFQRLNRHAEAMDFLKRCLEKDPDFLPAKISLAFSLMALGELEAAAGWFDATRRDFHRLPETILPPALEKAAGQTGNHEGLQTELQLLLAAVGQGGEYADLYYRIGRLYSLLEDPEKALNYYDRAGAINPGFIRASIGKAVTLTQLSRPGEAREILENLSNNNRLYIKITVELADLRRRLGQVHEAWRLLEELPPGDSDSHQRAARLKQELAARHPA